MTNPPGLSITIRSANILAILLEQEPSLPTPHFVTCSEWDVTLHFRTVDQAAAWTARLGAPPLTLHYPGSDQRRTTAKYGDVDVQLVGFTQPTVAAS